MIHSDAENGSPADLLGRYQAHGHAIDCRALYQEWLAARRGGRGCPSSAAELSNATALLSPACAARTLNLNTNFYRLNQNTIQSRTVQFALKFYF